MSKTLFELPTRNNLLTDSLHKRVIEEASSLNIDIFVVGGYLRDLVLNAIKSQYELKSKDLDYAVLGISAFLFAKRIADLLNGHFVALDEANDTARVVIDGGYVLDFAGCSGSNIEEDILRRDFTINALYLDVKQPEKIIDLVGGISDIKSGTIRALQSSVFIQDALRLLRAFRFAANLNFNIDKQTIIWIKENGQGLGKIAGERISSELFLIFKSSTLNILKELVDTGLLEIIFPELTATRSVPNNVYHHLNLFDHSVEAVIQIEQQYLAKYDLWQKTNLLSDLPSGISRLAVCKLATLLHDIGKPSTWVVTPEGKHTFIGHENIGGQMVPAIAKRLRWSNAVEDLIVMLIELHLRPGQLFHNTQASAKGINRLYRKAGENFSALILLALGDLGATKGPQMTEDKANFLRDKFFALLAGYADYCLTTENMKKILDGNDVMRLLNLAPGPRLGEILNALQEAQELKEVVNREQAINFVQSLQHPEK